MKHTIDAENKVLGRVANEAARLLLGKDSPAFQKNIVAGNVVEVINAGKMKMPEEKMMAEKYASHSGYPGSKKRIFGRNRKTQNCHGCGAFISIVKSVFFLEWKRS